MSASGGCGVSVFAAAVTDVLQAAGRRVVLVDAADPVTSGLEMAAHSEGPWVTVTDRGITVRCSSRGTALVLRMEPAGRSVRVAEVPHPRYWRPPVPAIEATVVDLGSDPWGLVRLPESGAAAWLRTRAPEPEPAPVLVVRPSRPSLMHAERLLSQWVLLADHRVWAPAAQLVVMGARRWPQGVRGAAGWRLSALLPSAVFVPHDRTVAAGGVTPVPMPRPLRHAAAVALRRCGAGLLPRSIPDRAGW